MELNIAVVSDLHCHHTSQGPAKTMLLTDADRTPSNQHPVEALFELIKQQSLRANILLMPGDITNEVDPQGMLTGWGFVQEIARSLGASYVAPTLGNHDVISRTPTDDAFKLARRLSSPKFPTEDAQAFDQFWSKGFFTIENEKWRVLVINSVTSHANEAAAKQGFISEKQIDDIGRYISAVGSKAVQVAVCHHHTMLHEDIRLGKSDVMENGSLLSQKLAEQKFCLIVHGHKHHPKLSYAPGAQPIPVLAAGSFSAGLKNGLASRTRNVFHLITIQLPQSVGTPVSGIIRTWQFREWKGWTPATWEAADFPHCTGFGCFDHPHNLASQIESIFRAKGTRFEHWSKIVAELPNIRLIPPSTFEAVGKRLKELGIDLDPLPPDEPKYIGVPQ